MQTGLGLRENANPAQKSARQQRECDDPMSHSSCFQFGGTPS